MTKNPTQRNTKLSSLVLVLGSLAFVQTPALAGSWTEMGSFASGLSYVDLGSVTHQKGLTQVVTMLSYDSPQVYSSKKTYQSTRTIMEFDCAKHLVHAQSVVFYSGPLVSGSVISKEGVISSLEPVPRSTPIEKIMHEVCG